MVRHMRHGVDELPRGARGQNAGRCAMDGLRERRREVEVDDVQDALQWKLPPAVPRTALPHWDDVYASGTSNAR